VKPVTAIEEAVALSRLRMAPQVWRLVVRQILRGNRLGLNLGSNLDIQVSGPEAVTAVAIPAPAGAWFERRHKSSFRTAFAARKQKQP
jgi:hypothetical protein